MASAPTIEGVERMQAKLRAISRGVDRDAPRALFGIGQVIMARSKREFVPVQGPGKKGNRNPAGALRASGIVQQPVGTGKLTSVSLEYGGPSAPYAAAIHNHPSGASPPSWNGKTLKFYLGGDRTGYLSKPLMEAVPALPRQLGKSIMKAVEKVGVEA